MPKDWSRWTEYARENKNNILISVGVGLVVLVLLITLIVFLTGGFSNKVHHRRRSGFDSDVEIPGGGNEGPDASPDPTPSSNSNFKGYQNYALSFHNEYRKRHQVGPLQLSEKLNEIALKCAEYYRDRGVTDNSCPDKGLAKEKLGENLYHAGPLSTSVLNENWAQRFQNNTYVAKMASNSWYRQGNRFRSYGQARPALHNVENFLQIIWKASEEFGFDIARTADGTYTVAVGIFKPRGVMGNNFDENVFPPE